MLNQFGCRPDGPSHQFPATVGAHKAELLRRAIEAEGTLERADKRFLRLGREVAVTAFAIRTKFERHIVSLG